MRERLLSSILRSFHEASLPTKVVIAAALYIAANHGKASEEFLMRAEDAWARAVKAELDITEIVSLYSRGVADYTEELNNYRDVMRFISTTLGEALAKLGVRE